MPSQLELVKYNFNQAASSYAQNAIIQAGSAHKIINLLPNYYHNGLILDLGSGPGTFIHRPDLNYPVILYDLSLNMLTQTRQRAGAIPQRASADLQSHDALQQDEGISLAVNGDANYLPFASNKISLIISNLMLQWPENKLQVLNEISRVLEPKGTVIFTTLIQPSLWQLQQAFQQCDNNSHTLEFQSQATYQELCQRAGLKIISCTSWEVVLNFANLQQLLRHFKLTGTSLPKSNSNSGLGGRQQMQRLEQAYQELKTNLGLPLSYKFLMICAQKELTYG